MTSSAASPAMLTEFWAKLNVSSVMLIWEMLGHVAPSQHRADGLADRRGAAQWTARPLHAGSDAREVVCAAGQQLRAFAGALFGQ